VLLEESVFKWYSQQRSTGVGVRGVELKAAAETFGITQFYLQFRMAVAI
jgi:hypothetical protein